MASDPRTIPDKALLWTLWMLVLAALGMATLLALVPAAGHDQLWFLLMAQRWLHGAPIYGAEIFDANTPTIVWLSAIPAKLAERSGMDVGTAGKLLVVLLEACVGLFSMRVLLRIQPSLGKAQRRFLAFAFICLFAVATARDFGQRDHLSALLCLPYVVLSAVAERRRGRRFLGSRTVAGVLAGIAVCLKPQLGLVPLTVELVLLLSSNWPQPKERRSLGGFRSLVQRPEPGLLLMVGMAFLLALDHFAPLFFTVALPTVLATYWAIGHLSPTELLRESMQLHVLGIAAFALFFVALRRFEAFEVSPLRAVIRTMLVAGVGATGAYYVQRTGWYYQQLPGICFFGLAIALEIVAISEVRSVRISRWSPLAAVIVAGLALSLTMYYSGYPLSREILNPDRTYAISAPDPSFFSSLAPGTPVATLTTSVEDAMMPVFRYRLTWGQRTNNLWLLPAIFRSVTPAPGDHLAPGRLSPERLAEVTAEERRWMVEDLNRWHPKVILVERCQSLEVHCQELEGRHDDLLAFFLADPAFAEEWRHYHFARRSGDYDAYELVDSHS